MTMFREVEFKAGRVSIRNKRKWNGRSVGAKRNVKWNTSYQKIFGRLMPSTKLDEGLYTDKCDVMSRYMMGTWSVTTEYMQKSVEILLSWRSSAGFEGCKMKSSIADTIMFWLAGHPFFVLVALQTRLPIYSYYKYRCNLSLSLAKCVKCDVCE